MAAFAALAISHAAAAQDAAAASNPAACLRFTFGPWSPALDWNAAGHATKLDSSKVDRAADGRAWAGATASAAGDSVLVLYPTFWPAGVAISFDARKLLPGDTVVAKATAFVADARVKSPVAKARVWAVPCR